MGKRCARAIRHKDWTDEAKRKAIGIVNTMSNAAHAQILFKHVQTLSHVRRFAIAECCLVIVEKTVMAHD